MKIVTTTRTLNEEANIERFIEGYSKFSDHIVVVDGGSDDDTTGLASKMGAEVIDFPELVSKQTEFGTITRNPQGKHINRCIQAAIDLGADWVIFDDADCVPTLSLQRNAKRIIKQSISHSVYLHRLYIYGQTQYFPEMNKKGYGLWAWNVKKVSIWADETDPWQHYMVGRPVGRTEIDYPDSVLHFFAPNEEVIEQKVNRTRMVYEHEAQYPLEFGGELVDLPKWAVWK